MNLASWNDAELQQLISGLACEEPACHKQARWFVTFGQYSGHLCGVHTVDHMEDAEYWEILRVRSGISMRAENRSRVSV